MTISVGTWGWVERLGEKNYKRQEILGGWICLLSWLWWTAFQLYIYVKTYQTVYFKHKQFIIYQLYLNKADKISKSLMFKRTKTTSNRYVTLHYISFKYKIQWSKYYLLLINSIWIKLTDKKELCYHVFLCICGKSI